MMTLRSRRNFIFKLKAFYRSPVWSHFNDLGLRVISVEFSLLFSAIKSYVYNKIILEQKIYGK